MKDFLAGLGYFALIGIIIACQYYRAEVYLPRQKAKRTGKDVVVYNARGGRVFRPDGTDFSFRSF